MGLRFRKRVKLAPGVHLNISKSGISTSLGPRGFTTNIRNGKRRTTYGLPGTGLSFQGATSNAPSDRTVAIIGIVLFVLWLLI